MKLRDIITDRRWALAALLGVCVGLYVPPAALTPFFTKGEPREGLVVRRMVEEGDWILPKRTSENGWTIASKPPFFHWLAAMTAETVGDTSELAMRFPSVLLGTLSVVAVWAVGRALLPGIAGVVGATVLATTFEWVRAVSTARVDGTLTAMMTFALLIFYRGVVRDGLSRGEALAAYLCLACATLTKGPVGFLLPGLVLGAALLVLRKLALVPRMRPILGAAVILLVAGAWYAAAWHLGGDSFFRKHVLKENVFRFLGASALKSGHEHNFFYYFPTFAAGFLPWTPFLVAALVSALRDPGARRDPAIVFLLVWVAVVFGFYSAASAKRSVYLLALYPAAALLTGWWWERLCAAAVAPRWLRSRLTRVAVAVTCVVVVLPLLVVAAEAVGFAPLQRLGPLLHPKDQANLPLVRGIIDDHLLAIAGGLAVVLAALAGTVAALRREAWPSLFASSAAFATALWFLVFAVFQPPLARERTLRPFLADVAGRVGDHSLYFYPGTFDFGAAFYAPRGTRHWRATGNHGPGPHYMLVWDDAVEEVRDPAGAKPPVLAVSEGTEPKGRRHMTLVRFD